MDQHALLSRLRSLIDAAAQAAPLTAPIRILSPFEIDPVALILGGSASPDGGQTWNLSPGSLWMRADLMTPEGPPRSYAGITIASGTLTLNQPAVLVNNSLVSSGNFLIQAVPEPHVVEGPQEGPGVDARDSMFSPPVSSEWRFENGRVTNVKAGDIEVRAFGNTFHLSRIEAPVAWDPLFRRIVVPMAAQAGRFEPISQSTLLKLSGSADLEQSAWFLTVAEGGADALGQADGPGSALLTFGRGLAITWTGLRNGSLLPASTHVLAGDNDLYLAALDVPPSPARHRMRLWFEERRAPEDGAALEARFDRPLAFLFAAARKGIEAFSAPAAILTHTDRFAVAEGVPFRFEGRGAFSISADSAGLRARVDALVPDAPRVSFALANALLTTQGPQSVTLDTLIDAASDSISGTLTSRFSLVRVLPILPDPYVANFDVRRPHSGPSQLVAVMTWPEPAAPELKVTVDGNVTSLLPPPLDEAVEVPAGVERLSRLRIAGDLGRPSTQYWLLDISSRADQLGVAFGEPPEAVAPTKIDNLALAASGFNLSVFTLPAVQWEPVQIPEKGLFISVDNGGPSGLSVQTVKLVPVAPIPASQRLVAEYNDDKRDGLVALSLPFGMRARVNMNHFSEAAPIPLPVPEVGFNMPAFDGFEGGLQLRFRGVEPTMRGSVRQLNNIAQPVGAKNVLDFYAGDGIPGAPTVSEIFNQRFTTTVPLERFDLSGYGESCFSDWRNPAVAPPDVSHVRFDVLVGRTSHEVVQVVAYLVPCEAVMVRTITLERKGSASVVRHDSGWLATTPGLFRLPASPCTFHPGAVKGYYNIREVRDTSVIVNVPGGGKLQAVYFDADVSIEGATRGARDAVFDGLPHRVVDARRHLGFIQLLPINKHLDPLQLADLFKQKGTIGGPLDCEIDIGGGRQKLRMAGMYADPAPKPGGGNPDFGVAVHGAAAFPQSGQWSAVRFRQAGANSTETIPVDGRIGVPLVRVDTPGSPYRIDDPGNLLTNSADSMYGFLFGNDSSRVLFTRPRIQPGALNTYETDAPKLGDPPAMAGSPGLFPKRDLVTMSAAPLDLSGLPQVLPPVTANSNREFHLINTPLFKLRSRSLGTPFNVRIDNNGWKVGSGDQEFVLDLLGFKDLMRVRGSLNTDAAGMRKMDSPRVDFGPALGPVQDLVDILRKLDLPFGLDLAVRTGADSLHLSVSAAVHLARPNGERIDIGIGKLSGLLRVTVGVEASISRGVQGNALLEISGDYQQSILGPLLYAGGYFRFRVGIDTLGQTQFELATGAVASIGGNLIPGLVELEATVKYAYRMILPKPGAIEKIRPGLLIGMGARAKLLSGFVGVSFDFEGQAVVERDGDDLVITLDIRVAASVTVAWVFEDDVEIDTQFQERVPFLVAVAVVGVVTGVGPVVI